MRRGKAPLLGKGGVMAPLATRQESVYECRMYAIGPVWRYDYKRAHTQRLKPMMTARLPISQLSVLHTRQGVADGRDGRHVRCYIKRV